LGAALLAGLAIGIYDDMEAISRKYSGTSKTFEPDPARAQLHQERLEAYRKLMATLLEQIY
jgi:sugar (pentulose or hexulose) kinase